MPSGTFRSLRSTNYRLWAAGALVSNIGTWMQRTAQDWLVLTQLTHHNATAVGIVMALQFGPMALLLPFTGSAADHFNRRKILIATQTAMGLLALGLGILTVTGLVKLWEVYGFALALGCTTAFDSPARQTFVAEMVGEADLSNAVALNSTSFNGARMLGPAMAGLLIAAAGTGWVFLINAASFVAVLGSLCLLRKDQMHSHARAPRTRGSFAAGLRYVWGRPDILVVLVMLFLIGTFSFNFAIFIATMTVSVFHTGVSHYGFFTSTMAVGSVSGALLAARRQSPRMSFLFAAAATLSFGLTLAALMPNSLLFCLSLMIVGLAAQNFTTTANSMIQMSTEPAMRGRVIAIFLAIAMGGTPVGAPIMGWIADHFGPRWAIGAGASAAFAAAMACVYYLVRFRNLHLQMNGGRPRLMFDREPKQVFAKPGPRAAE